MENNKKVEKLSNKDTEDKIDWIVTPGLSEDVERFIALYETTKSLPTGKNNIIICGPTGVGKSLFLHLFEKLYTKETDKKIERLNLASFEGERNLIRSELFGYVKGAFTGAEKDKKGIIEKANGGAIFLEEIGDIPMREQASLLTFVEDGYYYKVGCEEKKRAKVQLIGTTNKPRIEFRDDFWERFIPFYVPPIYERRGDVLYYLAFKYPELIKTLSRWEVLALLAYNWPGNVREIEKIGIISAWAQNLPVAELKEIKRKPNGTEFYKFFYPTFNVESVEELKKTPNGLNDFNNIKQDPIIVRAHFLPYENISKGFGDVGTSIVDTFQSHKLYLSLRKSGVDVKYLQTI